MAIGVFPVAKLGILAIKQISKPIANLLKNRAKNSPFFSSYVCMPPAQFYNWCEVKTKMWAMNLGKPITVPKVIIKKKKSNCLHLLDLNFFLFSSVK